MLVNVRGDYADKATVELYVNEIIKAHPDHKISAVDIIVEGDFLKIKCQYEDLDNIA